MSLQDFDWDKCEKGYKAKIALEKFYDKVGARVSIDLGDIYKDMDFFLNTIELEKFCDDNHKNILSWTQDT